MHIGAALSLLAVWTIACLFQRYMMADIVYSRKDLEQKSNRELEHIIKERGLRYSTRDKKQKKIQNILDNQKRWTLPAQHHVDVQQTPDPRSSFGRVIRKITSHSSFGSKRNRLEDKHEEDTEDKNKPKWHKHVSRSFGRMRDGFKGTKQAAELTSGYESLGNYSEPPKKSGFQNIKEFRVHPRNPTTSPKLSDTKQTYADAAALAASTQKESSVREQGSVTSSDDDHTKRTWARVAAGLPERDASAVKFRQETKIPVIPADRSACHGSPASSAAICSAAAVTSLVDDSSVTVSPVESQNFDRLTLRTDIQGRPAVSTPFATVEHSKSEADETCSSASESHSDDLSVSNGSVALKPNSGITLAQVKAGGPVSHLGTGRYDIVFLISKN